MKFKEVLVLGKEGMCRGMRRRRQPVLLEFLLLVASSYGGCRLLGFYEAQPST